MGGRERDTHIERERWRESTCAVQAHIVSQNSSDSLIAISFLLKSGTPVVLGHYQQIIVKLQTYANTFLNVPFLSAFLNTVPMVVSNLPNHICITH